jgi:hypothetical protein
MDTYATATYLNYLQPSHILMFEKLYILDFQVNLEAAAEHVPTTVIDLTQLANEGILIELPKDKITADLVNTFSTKPQLAPGLDPKLMADQLMMHVGDDTVRRWAMTVEAEGGRCIPLLRDTAFQNPIAFGTQTSVPTSVLDIAIRALAVPTVSLRRLAELRSDPVVESTFASLRNWFTGLARQRHTGSDAADELAVILDVYSKYFKARGIDFNRGELRVFVLPAQDVLVNLTDIQPSGVIRELFSVTEIRLELLRSSENIPGREVAFIAQAR